MSHTPDWANFPRLLILKFTRHGSTSADHCKEHYCDFQPEVSHWNRETQENWGPQLYYDVWICSDGKQPLQGFSLSWWLQFNRKCGLKLLYKIRGFCESFWLYIEPLTQWRSYLWVLSTSATSRSVKWEVFSMSSFKIIKTISLCLVYTVIKFKQFLRGRPTLAR